MSVLGFTHMETIDQVLSKKFHTLKANNPRYSLRSFAKSLDVPVSTLSEILSRKRPISLKLLYKLCTALNVSPESVSTGQTTADEGFAEVTADALAIIANPMHYALLHLVRCSNFQFDFSWIAERLESSEKEVEAAFHRLVRVGLLSLEHRKVTIVHKQSTHIQKNATSELLRNFQIHILENAIDKLRTVPIELRNNTSMTFAMNKKSLPFAVKEITKFRRKLTKQLEAVEDPDEVYQLSISLVPSTKINH